MDIVISPEILGAIVAAGVAAVATLKKYGLITFGSGGREVKAKCENCPDHKGMMEMVERNRKQTREDMEEVRKSLEKISKSMERKFDELEKLISDVTRALSDHIGYCRGIQQGKLKK